MRALITGATGFIGGSLLKRVADPVVLTRDPVRAGTVLNDAEIYAWNGDSELPPPAALEGIDAVFHLAGEPVASGRWTAAKKKRIHDSRAGGTARLVEGLTSLSRRPGVLVCASAVGW